MPDTFSPNQDEFNKSLDRIASGKNRAEIKFEVMRASYSNLCRTIHELYRLKIDTTHDLGSWKECRDAVCRANVDVLNKIDEM